MLVVKHKHPKSLVLVMIGIAVALFLASLGSAPGSYADDPTATPIVTPTNFPTPVSTAVAATSLPMPTHDGPSSGFWDQTSTPPPITATVQPFFVP